MSCYRPSREENDETIRILAERYPKCFFEDPKLRRPLKKNIIADLQQDGAPIASQLLTPAVEWYQSHFSYQYALEAGVKRINLNGEQIGTVTAQEALIAQKKIDADKAAVAERKNANQTLPTLHLFGRNDKKLDAPPMTAVATAAPSNGADLTPLRAMLSTIDTVLAATTENAGLRSALTTAALRVFIAEAEKLIATFEEGKQ